MDRDTVMTDLIKRHRKKTGDVNRTVEDRVIRRLRSLTDEDFQSITDWLFDNHPANWELDTTHINDAILQLGLDRHSSYTPAEDVVCDLCGMGFKYFQGADYEDKYHKGIHWACPRCGLDVGLTKSAEKHKAITGSLPDWYLRRLEEQTKAWESRCWAMFFSKQEDDKAERSRQEASKQQAAQDQAEQIARIKALNDRINNKASA